MHTHASFIGHVSFDKDSLLGRINNWENGTIAKEVFVF